MRIEDISEKDNIAWCRQYENNIFSDKPDENVIEFRTKQGIRGLHYHSDNGEKNLVIAPALGRHVHDQRLCRFFSSIDYFKGTTIFDYSGTYGSAGEFLPTAEGKLSIQEDLEHVIDTLHNNEPVELLGPCFGAPPAVAVAAERPDQVEAIYLFAPMLYGSFFNRYKEPKDKSLELGEFKNYPRYKGTEKEGWLENVWVPMIQGKTSLNAHIDIDNMPIGGTRIYGVACEQDNLISSKTLEDFAKAYLAEAEGKEAFFYIYEDAPTGEQGHFGHYALEYAPGTIKSFCKFIGKNPKEVIAIKKKIDMEFAEKARGKLPIDSPEEEAQILQGIKQLAETFYRDDEAHLRQIVKIKRDRIRKFSMLGFVKGIIL